MIAGQALLLSSFIVLIVMPVALAYCAMHIRAEEAMLHRRFGVSFLEYQRSSKKYPPCVW